MCSWCARPTFSWPTWIACSPRIERRALEHKLTPTIGRSHGIHAEPTTFGLKLAYALPNSRVPANGSLPRARRSRPAPYRARSAPSLRSIRASRRMSPGDGACGRAGLDQSHPARPPCHVLATLGVVASSAERLATEIRHLQRTEVLEAEEFFAEGQKGSSAMPHKRNPVLSENVTGLARMVRAYVTPALENVALWHERDISHSSVERMIGPDATATLDFALARLASHHRQARRLSRQHAQEPGATRWTRAFAAGHDRAHPKGVAREEAYRLVQRNAMAVWQRKGEFLAFLKGDRRIRGHLTEAEIEDNFDLGSSLQASRQHLRARVRKGV